MLFRSGTNATGKTPIFGAFIEKAFAFAIKKTPQPKEEAVILQLKNEALAALLEEKEEQIQRLERIARTDPLTGALNRRGFNEEFDLELARSHRSNTNGALCLIDIDRFKDINDRYGHGAGDEALIFLTRYLQDFLRKTDRIARLGGDEFALILPDCRIEPFVARIEKALKKLQNTPCRTKRANFTLRFSYGCVAFDGLANADRVYAEADQNMYAYKFSAAACLQS